MGIKDLDSTLSDKTKQLACLADLLVNCVNLQQVLSSLKCSKGGLFEYDRPQGYLMKML
jgi:hypothetical protein